MTFISIHITLVMKAFQYTETNCYGHLNALCVQIFIAKQLIYSWNYSSFEES